MRVTLQSRVRGGLATVASLVAILTGMALMNEKVREQVQRLFAGEGLTPEVDSSAHGAESAALYALDLLRDQSIAQAPLTIFALAASVLLLVMLRT